MVHAVVVCWLCVRGQWKWLCRASATTVKDFCGSFQSSMLSHNLLDIAWKSVTQHAFAWWMLPRCSQPITRLCKENVCFRRWGGGVFLQWVPCWSRVWIPTEQPLNYPTKQSWRFNLEVINDPWFLIRLHNWLLLTTGRWLLDNGGSMSTSIAEK